MEPHSARILLCDDSPIERTALAHFLRQSGYQVEEAADGATAINLLKNSEIDALLLDLHMPGTNGFDVLTYVQGHRRALPVMLLSGMPVDQIQHNIHRLPNQELPPLFLKPIDPHQLVQVLEMRLNGDLPLTAPDDPSDAHTSP